MTRQSISQQMHELMHQLPGMPQHSDAGDLDHRGGLPNRPLQHRPLQHRSARTTREHGEPKVLVDWQNAIGRIFLRGHK